MKQLVVISGKGGTGKTSVAACLALLARDSMGNVVAADCDVEAANLALLLTGEDEPARPFMAGRRAVVDPERCIRCAMCEQHCRFDAITVSPLHAEVDTLRCEGCGVCALVCATEAITFRDNQAGETMQRNTAAGPLVHARLGVAQDNSGKLVADVRQQARQIAERQGLDLCVVDGPPGIGCPVHAALTGCDLALVVTEPSASGEHDLKRVLELCKHFQMRVAVLINKHDLAPERTERIVEMAAQHHAPVVGRIPFDPQVPRALSRGEQPLKVPSFRNALYEAWPQIQEQLHAAPTAAQAVAQPPEQALAPASTSDEQLAEAAPAPTETLESVPSAPQRVGTLTRYADWAVGALETVASVVDALADRSDRSNGGARAEARSLEGDGVGRGRGRGEGRGLGLGRRDGSGGGRGRGQDRGGGQGRGGRGAGDGRGRWRRG